jgi:hypothetical protein
LYASRHIHGQVFDLPELFAAPDGLQEFVDHLVGGEAGRRGFFGAGVTLLPFTS